MTETYSDGTTERIESMIKRNFELIQLHFADYEQSAPFSHAVAFSWSEGMFFVARFRGVVGVTRENNGGQEVIEVERPQGRADKKRFCPATRSQTKTASQTITLPPPAIRANGELFFSEPACYEGTPGLINVDKVDNPGQIYTDVSEMIWTLNEMIHLANQENLNGRPGSENSHSSPFDHACDLCRTIKRNGNDKVNLI